MENLCCYFLFCLFIMSTKPISWIFFHHPTCDFCPLQVMLWMLLSLLPLVEGAYMNAGAAAAVGSDSGDAVGLLGDLEEPELPVTLPEVVEDEEQEDDSDPYSTWHALYGTEALT